MHTRGLTFDDVLLVPGYSHIESRKDVSTDVVLGPYTFTVPILSANMDTITGVSMAHAMQRLGGLPILHRFMGIQENVTAYKEACQGHPVGVSIGVSSTELERFHALYDIGARIFCLDVAHAHSKLVGKMLKEIRKYPVLIIVGNVSSYAGADYLASCGADVVKVGVGAGSVCTTRIKTGFGVPQLTAILDCARADVPIIADGGVRTPGDVVKALAAGATMVMLGGMLAGTDEAEGKGTYRGMASTEAQESYFGEVADWKTDEGVSLEVMDKGPVDKVIKDIVGGLRSGLTYAGARNINELHRKAVFMEVSQAAREESKAHAYSLLMRPNER